MTENQQTGIRSGSVLHAIVVTLSVVFTVVGLLLMACTDSTGFFPTLGLWLGLQVFGIGNLIILGLNGLCWRLYGGTPRRRAIVLLQFLAGLGYVVAMAPDVYHAV